MEYDICWQGIFGLAYGAALAVGGMIPTQNSVVAQVAVVIIGLLAVALHIMESLKLAKAFGKGTGFGVALIFFAPIARMVLGFGSAKYVGKQG